MATGNTMYVNNNQGLAWTWGDNSLGQAGVDPSQTLLSGPTQLARTDIASIAAGSNYACLTYRTASWMYSLVCFGGNESGQLGAGSTSSEGGSFTMPQGDGTWTFVAAGYGSTFAAFEPQAQH
ncbi:hypothetical protein H632_c2200p0 [Helicosporidium sp. ATCC 50920]|nr:hypothetical protein H632_c2200p0 [Helicosporidium sp. ATCC 50920]|eukprot:KDD73414.1 hypothetical protein H632_c2200p0 [Helicosporidium sp. ATCC 50920]